MADEINKRDQNRITTIAGVTDDGSLEITQLRLDPVTKKLKVTQDALDFDTDSVNVGNITTGGKFSEVLTLTNANTTYSVPSIKQNTNCVMLLYNPSDTDIWFKATNGTTGGKKIPPDGSLSITVLANVQYYVYCSEAGKTLNVEIFKLEI